MLSSESKKYKELPLQEEDFKVAKDCSEERARRPMSTHMSSLQAQEAPSIM